MALPSELIWGELNIAQTQFEWRKLIYFDLRKVRNERNNTKNVVQVKIINFTKIFNRTLRSNERTVAVHEENEKQHL